MSIYRAGARGPRRRRGLRWRRRSTGGTIGFGFEGWESGRAESMGLRRPQPLGASLGSGPGRSRSGDERNGAEERNRIESRDATRGERKGGGNPSSEMDGGCAWPGRGGKLCFPRRRVPPRPLGMGCACLVCFSGGGGGGVIKMMEGRWEDEWGFLSRLFRHSALDLGILQV